MARVYILALSLFAHQKFHTETSITEYLCQTPDRMKNELMISAKKKAE